MFSKKKQKQYLLQKIKDNNITHDDMVYSLFHDDGPLEMNKAKSVIEELKVFYFKGGFGIVDKSVKEYLADKYDYTYEYISTLDLEFRKYYFGNSFKEATKTSVVSRLEYLYKKAKEEDEKGKIDVKAAREVLADISRMYGLNEQKQEIEINKKEIKFNIDGLKQPNKTDNIDAEDTDEIIDEIAPFDDVEENKKE